MGLCLPMHHYFLCQLQIHVVKYGIMRGNPLMEYMKEREDFKDRQRVIPHYFSVTMVKRGRISKLAGLILGLLSDLLVSPTRTCIIVSHSF